MNAHAGARAAAAVSNAEAMAGYAPSRAVQPAGHWRGKPIQISKARLVDALFVRGIYGSLVTVRHVDHPTRICCAPDGAAAHRRTKGSRAAGSRRGGRSSPAPGGGRCAEGSAAKPPLRTLGAAPGGGGVRCAEGSAAKPPLRTLGAAAP